MKYIFVLPGLFFPLPFLNTNFNSTAAYLRSRISLVGFPDFLFSPSCYFPPLYPPSPTPSPTPTIPLTSPPYLASLHRRPPPPKKKKRRRKKNENPAHTPAPFRCLGVDYFSGNAAIVHRAARSCQPERLCHPARPPARPSSLPPSLSPPPPQPASLRSE